MRNPLRLFKYIYLRFLRLQGDPASLARGTAVGVFIGITPTIPFHTILIFLLSSIVRGNLLAGICASLAVSNPLTFFLQYYLSWTIGSVIIQSDMSWNKLETVLQSLTNGSDFSLQLAALLSLGADALTALIIGGVVLALPLALLGYIASYRFFLFVKEKRRRKHILY